MIILNTEADVSQSLDKRLLFHQAVTSDNARILVLNDTYIQDAKQIFNGDAYKNKVIFCDKFNKNELLLSSNILADEDFRKALVTGYSSLESIKATGRSFYYVDGFFILLKLISESNKELPLFTLGSWQTMNDDDLTNELNSVDLANLTKKEESLVTALLKTINKSSHGLKGFKDISNKIWRLHSHLMVNGEFKAPAEWLINNALIIVSTTSTKNGLGKVLLRFAFEADIELYLDSLVDMDKYLHNISAMKADCFISIQRDNNYRWDLCYLADDFYCSTQSFDSSLFASWLVRRHSDLIKRYTLSDFENAFTKYQFGSYVNAFLSTNESNLVICRLTKDNQFLSRDIDLSVVLEQVDKKNVAESTDIIALLDSFKNIEGNLEKLSKEINDIKNNQGQSYQDLNESDAIDRIFENTLLAQRSEDK